LKLTEKSYIIYFIENVLDKILIGGLITIRKRLSKKERKQQIQSAAKEIFLDKGFNDTTMDDIVKASGMSTGAFITIIKINSIFFMTLWKKE